jgi:hypothetical protein
MVGYGGRINFGFITDPVESENASYIGDFNVPPPVVVSADEGRSGIHEVGILVGILRKLQHWSFSSIVFEYRSFAGPNARFTEEQFIEVFDEKAIVLPSHLPTWWIEQEDLVHADDTADNNNPAHDAS